ncbi:hypothetical protein COLO4_24269 [Corchorus olitorius]|uniref:Uncharacterized protein n=1 Tax=Corchorus olitorius TaxID=93759 RepID=A0A1R3IBV7_9ROSI|nr:hypothetical protein COLO4_24269 [Corchorus olitorius]
MEEDLWLSPFRKEDLRKMSELKAPARHPAGIPEPDPPMFGEGKIVELAALLMVAHERLLGKPTYTKVGFVSDPSSLELHLCLKEEMSSAIYAETISKATFQSSNSVEICEARKNLMSSAHLLLKVFANAGYCIDRYLKSEFYLKRTTTNLQVAEEVRYLLKVKGFKSKKEFFGKDLIDMKWYFVSDSL